MYYGYEEPIAMPTMGVYDTSMMRMYMGALKDQYDETKKDFDEFNKTYGPLSFNSPIYGQNEEYYKLTTKPVQDLIDKYGTSNLLRSAEGRSMILLIINGVLLLNGRRIAELKLMSDVARQRIEQADKLKMSDLMPSDAYTDYVSGVLNAKTMADLDAPNPIRDVYNITSPLFKNLDKAYRIGDSNTLGYDIYGVDPETEKQLVGYGVNEIKNNPSEYNYYTNKIKLSIPDFDNLTVEKKQNAIDEGLYNLVRNSNSAALQPITKRNEEYFDNLRHQNAMSLLLEKLNGKLNEIRERQNNQPSSSRTKSTQSKNSKNGTFSEYQTISDATTQGLEDNITTGYVGKSSNGNVLTMYSIKTPNGQQYMVRDDEGHDPKNKTGWITSSDGKHHYRLPSQKELQYLTIQRGYPTETDDKGKVQKKSVWNILSPLFHEISPTIMKRVYGYNNMEDDKTGQWLSLTPQIRRNLRTASDVLSSAHGGVVDSNANEAKLALRILLDNVDVPLVADGKGGDVIMKNGTKDTYVTLKLSGYGETQKNGYIVDNLIKYDDKHNKYIVKVGKKWVDVNPRTPLLLKISEYNLNNEGTWDISPDFYPSAVVGDKQASSAVAGQANSVDISNLSSGDVTSEQIIEYLRSLGYVQ